MNSVHSQCTAPSIGGPLVIQDMTAEKLLSETFARPCCSLVLEFNICAAVPLSNHMDVASSRRGMGGESSAQSDWIHRAEVSQ